MFLKDQLSISRSLIPRYRGSMSREASNLSADQVNETLCEESTEQLEEDDNPQQENVEPSNESKS